MLDTARGRARRRADHRPRRRAATGFAALVLVLILLGGGLLGAYSWMTGASGPSDPIGIQIPQGANAEDIGTLLQDQGVIRSALAFRIMAQFRDIGSGIQAGRYQLSTNMPLEDVFDVLAGGPAVIREVQLALVEGLELKDVASEVEEQLGIGAREFLRRATSGRYVLPPFLPRGTATVEGFLYPETYSLRSRADADEVIRMLIGQFESEAAGLPWENARTLGLSPYEVVIVASMIEREARVEEDRAKISAVIHNRLEEGMRLEIDATVQYAMPEPNRPLTFDDLEFPSPFNTYLHDGLPPTPIASPRAESIRAALEPADVDFLYFLVVDEETGRHQFFNDYDSFLNVRNQLYD